MTACDIVVVGAGPYGLAAAAHLRSVAGLETRVFGEPMSFWQNYMPKGMFLRSAWSASHIADPHRKYMLEAYQTAKGEKFSSPIPLGNFVSYGRWFQQQVVPDVDRRKVVRIEREADGFLLKLQDGEPVRAKRVVVATGIAHFAWRPPEFNGLPALLASHSSEHRDFDQFNERRVAIIGAGQSALESAALLREAGADVEVFARSHRIYWLGGWASKTLHWRLGSITRRILYAPTDVGPAGISQLVARPNYFRMLPRSIQDPIARRSIRPAGAGWLRPRLEGTAIHLACAILSAIPAGGQLRLQISDGSTRMVDHLLFATGYRVDLDRYGFFAPELLAAIHRDGGYPLLRPGLESSVPGLHFLGAPAAFSFGPLMRFVSGAEFASRVLANYVKYA
jgi:FAD-dependent urate hydroxylase